MNARTANIILISSTLGLTHVVVLAVLSFPALFATAYGCRSLNEALACMLAPTRLVVNELWMFPALLVVINLVIAAGFAFRKDQIAPLLICGLCFQGLAIWLLAFCLCFYGFTGTMCLHHGPEFELEQFLVAGFGVFPVTLAALLVPIAVVTWTMVTEKKQKNAEQRTAPVGTGASSVFAGVSQEVK